MNDITKQNQEAIYTLLSGFGEALASPRRLKMISVLSQGEKTVDQLAGFIGQSRATTSAHLKVLRTSGLVVARKVGRHVYCSLASENVSRVWLTLRALGEELLPEMRGLVESTFHDEATLATQSMREVLREVESGQARLLDLRDAKEYATGHLPQAQHLAASELAEHLDTLDREFPLLTYCRGPYCLAALKSTQILLDAGFPVRRLPFGVPEWKAAGLPVVSESAPGGN